MDTIRLLGPLESDVMTVMWDAESATVRQVFERLSQGRAIAYTTVLTIMNNLMAKGLLRRKPKGKAHVYSVALSQEEFIDKECSKAVSNILAQFGDLAVARFLDQASGVRPDQIERLKNLAAGREAQPPDDGTPS